MHTNITTKILNLRIYFFILLSGVTPGYDMTPEAALTKLAFVLSKKKYDSKAKRRIMETNLRGELTICNEMDFNNRSEFLQSVGLNNDMELHHLAPLIYPTMLMEAVIAKDISKIQFLVNNVKNKLNIQIHYQHH